MKAYESIKLKIFTNGVDHYTKMAAKTWYVALGAPAYYSLFKF